MRSLTLPGPLVGKARVIFSNPNLRVYAFRALIVASITSLAAELNIFVSKSPGLKPLRYPVWLSLLLWCCIIIHHTAGPRFLYEIIDWTLVSFQVSCWFTLHYDETPVDGWSSQDRILLAGALYVQLVALLSLWLFRTAAIIISRGSNLLSHFDFFSECARSTSPMSVIFGQSLWQSRISDESNIIKSLRALLAIFLLAGLLLFGAYAMVINPVRETGSVPAKIIHTANPTNDPNLAVPVWSILAFMDMDIPAASQVDDFKAAVKVIPLWDESDSFKPECQHLPGNETNGGFLRGVQAYPFIQIITIFCPNRLGNDFSARDTMFSKSALTTPDLLIMVNFTALGITSGTLVDTRLSTVSIVIGLTNNTSDVLDSTSPIPLIPDTYLLGGISREFRRRFSNPREAALSVLFSSRTFLVGSIVALTTDPSPLVPRLNGTATLRLYGLEDVSDWVITEDYRDNSVWAGFAAVGGFWTFINGVFAVIFGSSLMLHLCGIKPFSIFGLADYFQVDRYRKAWQKDFPRLRTEGGLPGSEQAGFVAFLREHLIDLEMTYDGVDSDDVELQNQSVSRIYQPVSHLAMTGLPSSPFVLPNECFTESQ